MAAKKNWDIAGQLSLFDLMSELSSAPAPDKIAAVNVLAAPISFEDRKQKIIESAEEYLKKGERLTSLAREKFGEMIKLLSFTEVEEKLFSIKVSSYYLSNMVPKIATTVVRPLLKGLTTFDDNDEALKMLKSLVDYDIDIRQVDYESEGYRSAVRDLKRKYRTDKLISLTIKEERHRPLQMYGLMLNAHAKNRKDTLYKDDSMCGDIAEAIAYLICFTQYNRAVVNEDMKPAIEKALSKKRFSPMSLITEVIQKETGWGSWCNDYLDIRECYAERKAPIGLPLQKYRQPSEAAIEEFCKIVGADIGDVVRDNNISRNCMIDRNRLETQEHGVPYMYMLHDLDLAFMAIDPINWAKTERGKICYNDFLPTLDKETYRQENDPNYVPRRWPIPKSYGYSAKGYVIENVEKVLELVFLNYKEKVAAKKYFRENAESRAKVYETKKNIPEKTIKVMQESVLNDYFGYVELDEDCDLTKVEAIAAEFVAFKETYIGALDTSQVSIRFRKLGNHKAAGLYFPEIGCLCVDFRHPDSLIHEYGHCIDNVMGDKRNLSEEPDFYSVVYEYKNAFCSALYKSGKKLTGKYNEEYFTQRTEIFARCFEMYVTRTLQMENSICKQDSDTEFAYPVSDSLMVAINSYFEKLFTRLGEVKAAA